MGKAGGATCRRRAANCTDMSIHRCPIANIRCIGKYGRCNLPSCTDISTHRCPFPSTKRFAATKKVRFGFGFFEAPVQYAKQEPGLGPKGGYIPGLWAPVPRSWRCPWSRLTTTLLPWPFLHAGFPRSRTRCFSYRGVISNQGHFQLSS